MNPLLKDLGIRKGDVVTIVGTGGKTTLLFHLAALLAPTLRVLVTTTTKILVPEEESYDLIYTSGEALTAALQGEHGEIGSLSHGIVVAGSGVLPQGKLIGLSEEDLLPLLPFFDVVLIEGDGSRGKKLKAWVEDEPVVPAFTTKTIGVLPVTALGLPLTEENVHNLERFPNLAGPLEDLTGATATPEVLARVVLHGQGLFKGSHGERVLLLNQADTADLAAKGRTLADLVEQRDRDRLISLYLILSLEGSRYGNHSHYSSRRPGQTDAGRQAPPHA